MRHLHYDAERMLGYVTTDYTMLTALVEDDLDCLSLEALLAEQELEDALGLARDNWGREATLSGAATKEENHDD